MRSTFVIACAALAACAGCTIQDIFRTTLGGVNSDRAAMNNIDPANEYSYPQEDDRTVIRWPKSE